MFAAFGTISWDYAWFLFVLGLAATIVGQFGAPRCLLCCLLLPHWVALYIYLYLS